MKSNLPVPLRSDDGPVDDDGVDPELSVQSNTSEVDWLQPKHKPLSKLHETEANGMLNQSVIPLIKNKQLIVISCFQSL